MDPSKKDSGENESMGRTKIYQMFNKVYQWMNTKEVPESLTQQLMEQGADMPFEELKQNFLREFNKSGHSLQDISSKDDKSILKEFLEANSTWNGTEINFTFKRKTRKDFTTRKSMKQNYNYRTTLSASPVCNKRRWEDEGESSDSNEDCEVADLASYEETPHEIIENDIDDDNINEIAPSAATTDDTDINYADESLEDIKKLPIKDLIYKLFLNIYNNEEESILKYKSEIFPRITEDTQLDSHINYAISKWMDHVKDELQSYIKKHLKSLKKKSINELFQNVSEHQKQYNEIIDKIIDFYDLFKSSISNIVEIWKEKLGHIERLYDIFEFRHKKLFAVNIWQDKEIMTIMRLYFKEFCTEFFELNSSEVNKSNPNLFKQSYGVDSKRIKDGDENQNRIYKLKRIEDDLNENTQSKVDGSGKSKKKSKRKPKKKKSRDNINGKNEESKLYEINDIDLLCDMINEDKQGTK